MKEKKRKVDEEEEKEVRAVAKEQIWSMQGARKPVMLKSRLKERRSVGKAQDGAREKAVRSCVAVCSETLAGGSAVHGLFVSLLLAMPELVCSCMSLNV